MYSARPIIDKSRLQQLRPDILAIIALQLFFWIAQIYDWDLPGLYMDAVNPDFLAARTINPQQPNPFGAMPTALFPVLGNFYHGVQNYYVGLPVFLFFGFNLLSLRIAQGLFGAGIVTLVYLITKRISNDKLLGLLGAIGLATELAFIGSFRTQFYIVISGAFWLLASIYALLSTANPPNQSVSTRCILSGLCFGLAVYGYFIYLFFLPAVLVLILFNTRNFKLTTKWIIGFVLGMMTYVFGYILAFIELGGITSGINWITNFLHAIESQNTSISLFKRVAWSFEMLRLAMSNTGNEYMIFNYELPSLWASVKFYAFIIVIATGVLLIYRRRLVKKSMGDSLIRPEQLIWLILSFFLCMVILEKRVWIHHFSSVLPLFYLVAALMFGYLLKHFELKRSKQVILGVFVLLVAVNINQQARFFDELELTGGKGKWSDSINRLASDAVLHSPKLTHLFPEWGFYMSFAFLTANKVPFTTDLSSENLRQLSQRGGPVRLYFWEKKDEEQYATTLRNAGWALTSSGSYLQRDKNPSFYWIQGQK